MVQQSGSQSVGVRFGAYVEELREFFSSRDVRFGSPEDVVGFAERVAEPGPFQEEMGSLVRSIFFREAESLGRGELLELVSVAVGGPEVETAAQEMHASVRQVFVFVNSALRQRQHMVPGELRTPEDHPVTAGDILAASAAEEKSEVRAVAGRSPENGFYAGSDAEAGSESRSGEAQSVSQGSGVLFRAVSMSEAGRDETSYHEPAPVPTRRPWVLPAVIGGLLVCGAAGFVGLRYSHAPGAASTGLTQSQTGSVSSMSCVGSIASGTSRANVQERSRWAHNLLDQKLYDAALPELRAVARMDPGFPGINLDESDALLQLKRPEEARDAVDTQIGISECLAKLPGAALDNYCAAEFSPSTVSGCRPQLAHIRQAAELQAALVHLELGHRANPEAGAPEPGTLADRAVPQSPAADANGPARTFKTRHVPPLPPATDGDAAAAPMARVTAPRSKQDRKSNGDDSLRRGEGTDSALGAYSKPE